MNDGKVSAEQFKAMGGIPVASKAFLMGSTKKTKGDLGMVGPVTRTG